MKNGQKAYFIFDGEVKEGKIVHHDRETIVFSNELPKDYVGAFRVFSYPKSERGKSWGLDRREIGRTNGELQLGSYCGVLEMSQKPKCRKGMENGDYYVSFSESEAFYLVYDNGKFYKLPLTPKKGRRLELNSQSAELIQEFELRKEWR